MYLNLQSDITTSFFSSFRKEMVQTCIDILKNDNIGVKVIPSIVTFFDLLVPNVKDRMVLMAELISDIREPLESDDQEVISLIKSSYN